MNLKLKKLWIATCFLFIFLILLFNSPTITYAQRSGEAYVYCFPRSYTSEMLFSYFNNDSNWKIILHDLNNSALLDRFLNLTKTLSFLGVNVIPPHLCTSCELEHLTWDEILTAYGSPLIGFFRNERLTAITIGIIHHEILDQALMVNDENVKVFTPDNVHSLSCKDVRTRLEELFLAQEGNGKTEMNFSNLVFSITSLALADSVNPCTFALFTALLFTTIHDLAKTRSAITGVSFILAIFIGYYFLGLGVFRILVAISHLDKVLAILGLVFGISAIMRGLKVKFKHPIPKSFHRFMELRKSYAKKMLRKSDANVISSFFLGLTATCILLPCSGGPYIVGLGLLSILKNPIQKYLFLALYDLIFVTPLIFVLATVLVSSKISYKIKVFRSTNLGIMELVSGTLLVIICICLLLAS